MTEEWAQESLFPWLTQDDEVFYDLVLPGQITKCPIDGAPQEEFSWQYHQHPLINHPCGKQAIGKNKVFPPHLCIRHNKCGYSWSQELNEEGGF